MTALDYLMVAANLTTAVIVVVGVYLMNVKGIGRGAQPMFAVPFALMVVALYEFCFLMFEGAKTTIIKWIITGLFAAVSTAYLVWVSQQ